MNLKRLIYLVYQLLTLSDVVCVSELHDLD